MTKQVEAVYKNGVLRPLEPLSLAENERVTVTISINAGECRSLLELRGLGKDVWRNVNVADYLRRERSSWNG